MPTLLPTVTDNVSFTTGPDGRTYLTPTLNYSDYGAVLLTDPGAWGGGTRRSGFVGASGDQRRDQGDPPGGHAQVRRAS